ncbi:MFS transporter [Solimonas marina]|uniref:MFS transporter n=1 Tax=Solimonas marina TaxID=2714601 RepID=A0A969W7F5_9GAMM|nr:MFS transporter [Solimonas marina]NKF21343.1 MFS transporter [Solimonas marina]
MLSDPATRRSIIPLLFNFTGYLIVGVQLAVLPSFVHLTLGYGTFVVGLVIGTQYLATMLSRGHAGAITDRIGPQPGAVAGLAGSVLSCALMTAAALSTALPWLSLGLLLLGRIVLGISESFWATGSIMWATRLAGPQHMARAISWNGISSYGAMGIGAPLGVVLTGALSLQAVGILGMGLTLLVTWAARRGPPVETRAGRRMPLGHVLTRVLPYGLCLAMGGAAFGAVGSFIVLHFLSRHWDGAALALSAFTVGMIAVRLVFNNSINHHGGYRVAFVCFTTEIAGLALIGLATTPLMATVGSALAGLGFSLVFPALAVEVMRTIPDENRGAALGVYSVFIDLAMCVTGPLGGLLVFGRDYRDVYFAAALLSAIALLVTWRLFRRAQRAASP